MTKDEIMKELDKFEIPYETDANKPRLQELLDAELARRAAGEDGADVDEDPPEAPDEPDAVVPEKSEEDRVADLEAAQEELAEAVAAGAKAAEAEEAARKRVAENLPKQTQASLADCVNMMQAGVRRDSAVKAEMSKLAGRFQDEAKKILDGDEE